MNIAHHMVDVALVYDNLRIAALYKHLLQLLQVAGIHVYGIYFGTRNHAVAHLGIWEVKSVLEYIHLVVDIFFILCIIDARLHKIVEVYLCESLVVGLFLHFYANHSKKHLRQESREFAY